MRTGNAPVLSGARILLTARRRGDDLASALEARGAVVQRAPTIASVAESTRRLVRRTHALLREEADVVVVATATGLERWLAASAGAGIDGAVLRLLRQARVVARGPKARAALEAVGVVPDWLGEAETVAEIIDFLLAEGVDGARVVLVHGGGRDEAEEVALRAAGAHVRSVRAYRWVSLDDRPEVRAAVEQVGRGRFDAVLFTSAPGAHAWLRAVRRAELLDVVRDRIDSRQLLLGAVGPVTAEPLAFAGLLARVPSTSRLADLVRLVIEELGDDRHALMTGHGLLRLRAGTITLDHRAVALSPSGLALLRRLASTPGHVVSREELLRVLPGASTDPHTAEVAVARLREALRAATGDDTGDGGLVKTVVRRGYVLAAR